MPTFQNMTVSSDAHELIRRHALRIRLYAVKVAPRPDMADDIAQKALLIALRDFDKFDSSRDFALWVEGVVRNVARHAWRALSKRNAIERDALAEHLETLARTSPEPTVDDHRIDALRDCTQRLPKRSRQIVNLHYGLEVRCHEVAERVGTTRDAVKTALSRIRRSLRDCIEKKLVTPR